MALSVMRLTFITQSIDSARPSARWYALLIFLMVFCLCYAAVLLIPYGFLDDYTVLSLLGIKREPELKILMIAGGRPLQAVWSEFFFPLLRIIGDLRYIRLLSVVSITFLAWSVWRTLVSAGWERVLALFLSVIMCTTPPFQVYASWATAGFCPLAAFIAGGAWQAAERAYGERRSAYKWGLAIGAVLCLLGALLLYQPAAMFFWVFAAIILFKPEAAWSDVGRRLLWYGVIVAVGLLSAFVVYKFGVALHGDFLSPQRATVTHDVVGKANWFLQGPMVDALNTAKLFPKRELAVSVAIFILGGLLLYIHGAARERLLISMAALTLLPLSYLPNLVVAENWSSYRTQSALTSLIVLYAFFALWGYYKILARMVSFALFTRWIGVIAFLSGLLAAWNVSAYFAIPQYRELTVLRNQLAQFEMMQAHSLVIRCARAEDLLAPSRRYDEFGAPSSSQPWASGPMAYLLLRELGVKRAESLPIKVLKVDDLFVSSSGVQMVDMAQLLGEYRQKLRRD
jgi:hypothetical protein